MAKKKERLVIYVTTPELKQGEAKAKTHGFTTATEWLAWIYRKALNSEPVQ